MTLTEFLLARIAEDEKWALKAKGDRAGRWASWNRSWDDSPNRDLAADGMRVATLPMWLDEHVARHDPARVLAECEAKRRIVGLHPEILTICQGCAAETFPCRTLLTLALPYADHPDFQDEWRA